MQLMHYVQLKPSSESSQKEMAEALFRFYAKSLRGFSWKLGFHVERIGEESFPVPGCPHVQLPLIWTKQPKSQITKSNNEQSTTTPMTSYEGCPWTWT